MLERVVIKNLAVIHEAEISFTSGLNIISGETGAGKSIILQAISLLLGERASAESIRKGCSEAMVQGLFNISSLPHVQSRLFRMGLTETGLESESSELLIKRVIHTKSRHRVYVNNELITLSALQELTEGLIDLCGQREHQSLLKSQRRIELLDRYGGLTPAENKASQLIAHVRSVRKQLESLNSSGSDFQRQLDFVRFQLEELRSAELVPDEEIHLQEEKKSLASAQLRMECTSELNQLLDSERGCLALLSQAGGIVRKLVQLDEQTQNIAEQYEVAQAHIEELSFSCAKYLDSVDARTERIQELDERLALLASLRRKYGESNVEMLKKLSELEEQLETYEGIEGKVAETRQELEKLEAELKECANDLSKRRKSVAKVLGKSVSAEFTDLRMDRAELFVEIGDIKGIDTWAPKSISNTVDFIIRTNEGESAKSLSKIASGGELSRILLAIRRVIADRGSIGVYLFDEIDSGMGGQTAFEVGRKLKSVAKYNQVICITHLPQVAAFAHHHLSVQKSTSKGRTFTQVAELESAKDRESEIARMLGGVKITPTSRKNASELIRQTERELARLG